jgi:hypothetical protein
VALAATAIIATLGGVVYNRVSGDKAAVAALPSAPWIPFEKGQANVIFKDQLKYCEDALFDHEKGMAILSCDLGRAEWNTVMVNLPALITMLPSLTLLQGNNV